MGLRKFLKKIMRRFPWPLMYEFAMSPRERELFDEMTKNVSHFLEFGMGGSTIRMLHKTNAIVHSVESNHEWIELLREYPIVRRNEDIRLFIHHVDIGPLREWGKPLNEERKEKFPGYSRAVFERIDASRLDIVLIDGRFRVACAAAAWLSCNETNNYEVRILFHDFPQRPEYHEILEFVDVIKQEESLMVFRPRANIDTTIIEHLYEKYKYDPR